MSLFESVRLAFRAIWSQKMKSGFSMVGVFIGVTFLIAVVSIVEGMNRYMTERFAGTIIGLNTFHVRQRPSISVGDVDAETRRAMRRRPLITYDDARAVATGLTVPVLTAWESDAGSNVEYRGRVATNVNVTTATESYLEIKGLEIEEGRAFSSQEAERGTPVAVIGNELADRLFEGLDPLGREIRIRGFPFRVIGVAEEQGNLFGFSLDNFTVVPALSHARRFVNPPRIVDALIVKAETPELLQAAMSEAEAIMRSRRQLRPTEENNFALETADGVLDFWQNISRILFTALPGLVGISLVVGGIVIMNIMLMAVAERTREIGLRKSLGARRKDILAQFLVESATLSSLGAAVGIATGIALAGLIESTTPLPAGVAPWSLVVGILLGGGVGIVAGVYPATRAARLDPITALRHDG